VVVCLWQADDPFEYMDKWYSSKLHRRAYARHMYPMQGEDLGDDYSDCGAPELTRQRGRLKKKIMQRGEKGNRRNVYGFCGGSAESYTLILGLCSLLLLIILATDQLGQVNGEIALVGKAVRLERC
jgi:hypothetical protein